MNVLSPQCRKQLERTIADARDIAEQGGRNAIEALAVCDRAAYEHMSAHERTLRRRLRAHARQLGDWRESATAIQATEHLVQECAYEQWHGMLFARFLAENNLLVEPEMGAAVALDECEELAKDANGTGDGGGASMDKWMLATRFAHAMLPQVFRPDLPVFDVRFAREHRQKLEAPVERLPTEVFTASDALGWVYQFWQSQTRTSETAPFSRVG